MEKKLSVIVVCYYSGYMLDELLKNVNEKISDVGEFIIVNNSKEDRILIDDKKVKVLVPQENLGYGQGINYALSKVSYDNILIINPDIHLNKFEFDFNSIKEGCYFIGCSKNKYSYKYPSLFADLIKYLIGDFPLIGKSYSKIIPKKKRLFTYLEEVEFISGSFILTNKSTMEKTGGFDKSFFLFYEETDLFKRAEILNIPVYLTNSVELTHYLGKSSTRNVDRLKICEEFKSFLVYHSRYSSPEELATVLKILRGAFRIKFYFYRILKIISHKNYFLRKSNYVLIQLGIIKKYYLNQNRFIK